MKSPPQWNDLHVRGTKATVIVILCSAALCSSCTSPPMKLGRATAIGTFVSYKQVKNRNYSISFTLVSNTTSDFNAVCFVESKIGTRTPLIVTSMRMKIRPGATHIASRTVVIPKFDPDVNQSQLFRRSWVFCRKP
jgi:hypothetical protein